MKSRDPRCRARRLQSRRAVTTTEYMLLISVMIVALVACAWVFLPSFTGGVGALVDDVYAMLAGEGIGDMAPGRETECPYTYDSRTGRWHDEASDYTMISFADAEAAGC